MLTIFMLNNRTLRTRFIAGVVFALCFLSFNTAEAQPVEGRLQPPDTTSPRATLFTFLSSMGEAYKSAGAEGTAGSIQALQRAVRCLDLSELPPRLAEDQGIEAALMLKEVLARIELPPAEAVPVILDDDTSLHKWRIPKTEITIALKTEGPRSGEYLFSSDTVARTREFYERVQDLPYLDRSTPGIYNAYLTTPGPGIDHSWDKWLPGWSVKIIAEQTVWQWLATGLTLCVLLVIIGLLVAAARRIDHREPESASQETESESRNRLIRWQPAMIIALSISFAAINSADWFIDEVVNLAGFPDDVVTYFLSLLGFITLAWLGMIVAKVCGELLIRVGGFTDEAASSRLIRLISGAIGLSFVVGIFVYAAQEFGLPGYSIVTGLGVGGIAIGFGAQSLVRDILSGVLFLVDDAFRVGEYIDTGSAKGTVEKISARSMQLRHHDGPLDTIPFGEIKQLRNYSRDWVIMKLPIRVAFGTDTERIRKLIKKLGIALLEDPEIGDKFIEPLKSQGVWQLDDFGIVMRVKFKTTPGEQFDIRRIVYLRIQELFEREGIEFAGREVRVKMTGESKDIDQLPESLKGTAADIGDDDPSNQNKAN